MEFSKIRIASPYTRYSIHVSGAIAFRTEGASKLTGSVESLGFSASRPTRARLDDGFRCWNELLVRRRRLSNDQDLTPLLLLFLFLTSAKAGWVQAADRWGFLQLWDPHSKDDNVLGSILGSPCFGTLPGVWDRR